MRGFAASSAGGTARGAGCSPCKNRPCWQTSRYGYGLWAGKRVAGRQPGWGGGAPQKPSPVDSSLSVRSSPWENAPLIVTHG